MTRDADVLRAWLLVVVVIAAMGATAVPIIYSFLPWTRHRIGPPFMLQAVSLAGALDMTVLFAFWRPDDILVLFWVQVLVFTAIAVSTSTLVWVTIRMRYPNRKRIRMLFMGSVYDRLKWFVQIVLPSAILLWLVVANAWDLPHTEAVVATIAGLGTFLGACLGISTKTYNAMEADRPVVYDGQFVVEPGEGGSQLRLTHIEQKAVETKDAVLLKLIR
jgi:hypothetical protein